MGPFSTFKLHPRGTRAFTLLDAEGRALGEMRSPRFFSQDLAGTLDGRPITCAGLGFWNRVYSVSVDGTPVGEVRFGWGAIRLVLGGTSVLDLVRKELFSSSYLLLAGPGHPLLEIRQAYDWRAFAPEYTITVVGRGAAPEQVHLLAMMCGCALRIRRARAAATAG